ncbi:MAG: hypothetical protein AAF629_07185, partial [Chloroflexota bacterium]
MNKTPFSMLREHITYRIALSLVLALTFSLSLGVLQLAQAQGPIIRVTVSGNPAQDGRDWANATTLTQALAIASPGDEIWVATGIYTPGTTVTDTFNLAPGVALYGGFAATETIRLERNWEANPTILSGDIDGDDVTTAGVVLTTTDIVGDNSYHVLFADGTLGTPITETTVLDGLIITAGQANGNDDLSRRGGGLYCAGNGAGNECSPTFRNIIFSGNLVSNTVGITLTGGGAIYSTGSDGGTVNPIFNNVTFSGNSASNTAFSVTEGGAIFNDSTNGGTSNLTFQNVTFSDNSTTGGGGAISNSFGDNNILTLSNITFTNNSASYGGAIYNLGGFTNTLTLTDVTFTNNSSSDGDGGAIANSLGDNGTLTLTDVSFSNNSAN